MFQGLIDSCSGASLDEETNVRMISLFDNEEVSDFSKLVAYRKILHAFCHLQEYS